MKDRKVKQVLSREGANGKEQGKWRCEGEWTWLMYIEHVYKN
jgi:hypothetical protein